MFFWDSFSYLQFWGISCFNSQVWSQESEGIWMSFLISSKLVWIGSLAALHNVQLVGSGQASGLGLDLWTPTTWCWLILRAGNVLGLDKGLNIRRLSEGELSPAGCVPLLHFLFILDYGKSNGNRFLDAIVDSNFAPTHSCIHPNCQGCLMQRLFALRQSCHRFLWKTHG